MTIDLPCVARYHLDMRVVFRALALILVLTFATGTLANAIQATEMAVEMALKMDSAEPNCDGCDDDDASGKLTCAPACVAPAAAIVGSDAMAAITAAGQAAPSPAPASTGRSQPIDPYPPRSIVLI